MVRRRCLRECDVVRPSSFLDVSCNREGIVLNSVESIGALSLTPDNDSLSSAPATKERREFVVEENRLTAEAFLSVRQKAFLPSSSKNAIDLGTSQGRHCHQSLAQVWTRHARSYSALTTSKCLIRDSKNRSTIPFRKASRIH